MIDYISSKIAQREYEERIRAISPITDADQWLKREAGLWHGPSMRSVLASCLRRLAFLGHLHRAQPQTTIRALLTEPEISRVKS